MVFLTFNYFFWYLFNLQMHLDIHMRKLKPNSFMFQFHQNNSQLLFCVIVSLRGAGAFSRNFTTNLARALKIEKLKAPLFPDPRGARDTNDWCIMQVGFHNIKVHKSLT